MMNKFLTLLVFYFFLNSLLSQVGVLCVKFEENNKTIENEEIFIQGLESAISNIDNPPFIVDRSRLGSIFNQLKIEENIIEDLGGEYKAILESVKVDYLLFANVITSPLKKDAFLRLEFISIEGGSLFSKKYVPTLKLTLETLGDPIEFERVVRNTLNDLAFIDKLGIVEVTVLEEINRRIDKKDSEIQSLHNKIDAISEYAQVAELDVFGRPPMTGGEGIKITSPLIELMAQAIEARSGKLHFFLTDKATSALTEAIKVVPKFPFSYYALAIILKERNDPSWRTYASMAKDILEKTILNLDCHQNHNQVLREINGLLSKF